MNSRFISLLVAMCAWCSCKSVRHVKNDALEQTRIGGSDMMESKFQAKPEDASWFSTAGDEDGKTASKQGKHEAEKKRSMFEKVVSENRSKVDAHGPSQWDKRANYEKEWSGSKEKKTFTWPWQKGDVKKQESLLAKDYAGLKKDQPQGEKVAREDADTFNGNSKMYATTDYQTRRPDITKKEEWMTEKADAHHQPKIIEDRSKPKDDEWSISDIRTILGKH